MSADMFAGGCIGWALGTSAMWLYMKLAGLIRTKEEYVQHYLNKGVKK